MLQNRRLIDETELFSKAFSWQSQSFIEIAIGDIKMDLPAVSRATYSQVRAASCRFGSLPWGRPFGGFGDEPVSEVEPGLELELKLGLEMKMALVPELERVPGLELGRKLELAPERESDLDLELELVLKPGLWLALEPTLKPSPEPEPEPELVPKLVLEPQPE